MTRSHSIGEDVRVQTASSVDGTAEAVERSGLDPFLAPEGVCVVGASTDPSKLGFTMARNLVQGGYGGAVHLVGRTGGTLFGRPVHASVLEVPDPVDLAVLLIPAAAVPQALREAGERGLRAAVIGSGGFRETGAEGEALEAECLRIARRYGMRLIGPNCVGLLDTHLPLDTTFLPPPGPPPGDVAFVSHSGAICAAVVDWSRGQGFGLSRLVSLGNQLDVCETDLLGAVAADPHTRVLTLYLEGLRDGRRFVAEAGRVSRETPVVALKVGRSDAGRRAVASHTGALAGREAAYDAAFRRAGVLRAPTSEALFDWARVLAWCPLPKGRRVAVLTNAGGPGVAAADAASAAGLIPATLAPETKDALRAVLPPAASLANPVDMLASATPEQYAESLRLLTADDGVDSVLVILPPPPASTAGAVARALIPVVLGAGKPVLVALMGDRMIQEAVEYLRAARVPDFRFPERAAEALAVLSERAAFLARPEAPPAPLDGTDPEAAAHVLERADVDAAGFLSAEDAGRLLAAYGLDVPTTVPAATADAAVEAAEAVGYPVAVKVASPDLPHKSDVDGVVLDVQDAEGVRAAFRAVTARVRAARPEADVQGVLVQRMLPPGQDVIVGAVQDPQFGALAMFGSGGIEVEGLGDVAFALAPLPTREADEMMDATWAGRKLHGFRSVAPADRAAAREALLRIAALAAAHPAVAEVEVNPLRVLSEGRGAVALDVRVRLDG